MTSHAAPLGRFLAAVFCLLVLYTATGVLADAINFESPPVHPVELSPNGDYLFVAHTADHRLVIYYLGGDAPFSAPIFSTAVSRSPRTSSPVAGPMTVMRR